MKELGRTELAVLQALWNLGPSSVRQVLECLQQSGRDLAYTTVQTLLVRLESKGYVTGNKRQTAFTYRAKVTRDKVTRSRLRTLLNQLYDGQAGSLVLQLIQNERFSAEEIRSLREHLDRLQSNRGEGRGL